MTWQKVLKDKPKKCTHCGYIWNSKSNLTIVTCPCCGYKTGKPFKPDEPIKDE